MAGQAGFVPNFTFASNAFTRRGIESVFIAGSQAARSPVQGNPWQNCNMRRPLCLMAFSSASLEQFTFER
jgi:hypothetical protein